MQQSIADKGLLAIILLAIFVVPSSISGTAVALPAIGLDIHAPLTSLQWVVNAFNLTFACFTLSWGAVADNFGRKTCFSLGAVLYALASLLSALADSPCCWICRGRWQALARLRCFPAALPFCPPASKGPPACGPLPCLARWPVWG